MSDVDGSCRIMHAGHHAGRGTAPTLDDPRSPVRAYTPDAPRGGPSMTPLTLAPPETPPLDLTLTGLAAIDAAWADWRAAVDAYEDRDPAADPDQYGADGDPGDDDWGWDDDLYRDGGPR